MQILSAKTTTQKSVVGGSNLGTGSKNFLAASFNPKAKHALYIYANQEQND
jgi:hypothetical protein